MGIYLFSQEHQLIPFDGEVFSLLEPALSAFVPTTPLASRRWAVGFELPRQGEGVTGGALNHSSRDASRTSKGLGFAYRSLYNESINSCNYRN